MSGVDRPFRCKQSFETGTAFCLLTLQSVLVLQWAKYWGRGGRTMNFLGETAGKEIVGSLLSFRKNVTLSKWKSRCLKLWSWMNCEARIRLKIDYKTLIKDYGVSCVVAPIRGWSLLAAMGLWRWHRATEFKGREGRKYNWACDRIL